MNPERQRSGIRRICFAPVFLLLALTQAGCQDSQGGPLSPDGSGSVPLTPGITKLSPDSVVAGSADLILTVNGQHIDTEGHLCTVVVWSADGNDVILHATNATTTAMTAIVPAALIAKPLIAEIYVQNYDVQSDADL